MKYKLYNPDIETDNVIEQILLSRGIQEDEIEDWIAAKPLDNPGSLNDIEAACLAVKYAIDKNQKMCVVVDCDADGFTSAAIFINYLYMINPEYGESIDYILHTGKQHGLADVIDKVENYEIVICPDSASNDYEFHEYLFNKNINIVILDHHEVEYISSNAIIVNNQLSDDYKNKSFSGAGITYRFCEKFYEELQGPDPSSLLDLVALGNLSDMMDYRSQETRHFIQEGLSQIRNPFMREMIKKNQFSIDKKGGVNYNSMAWYVTPFVNAVVRSGTQEEKKLLFESMLDFKGDSLVPSGKRGHKGEMVPLAEEAVRQASNVKARQTKLQDASMALLEKKIKEQNLTENGILTILCEPGEVEKNIAGLAANKLQSKYQKPCLVLTKYLDPESHEYSYSGSARNYSKSPIENFKDLCEQTGLMNYAQGHQGAWGGSIPEDKIEEFIQATNDIYKDIDQDPVYWVDYIWRGNTNMQNIIFAIADMNEYWGQEIPESKVAVEDICLENCQVQLLSPDKNPTIKITLPNGVDVMKFKSSKEEFDEWSQPNKYLTIIATPNKNEWNRNVTAQLMIEDFDLQEKWVF